MALPAGVPQLLTGASDFSGAVEMLTADALDYFSGTFGPQWGIFQGGSAVVTADTVISFEYRKDWVVGDYPIEGGSFQSYDKVEQPFDARVRFVAGGSESNRQAMLNSIAAIAGNTQLYDVVTPEATYTSATICHNDYRRTAVNGLGLIAVDVWVSEIRQASMTGSGGSDFSGQNTNSPSGSDPSNGGSVQPTAATVSDFTQVSSGYGLTNGIPSFAGTSSINFSGSPYGSL